MNASFAPNTFLEINADNINQKALELFAFQYANNELYGQFCNYLNRTPNNISTYLEIPFLPISFFKSNEIKSTTFNAEIIFESSGTTGITPSRHFVKETSIYENAFVNGFEQYYGAPEEFVFLCLLPSYLERGHSSLVYMADYLIKKSGHSASGFYLYNFKELAEKIQEIPKSKKIILLGVTYALLDFAEAYPIDLSHLIVMETGGMKGRKEEWPKEQIHQFLKEKWNLATVHSEYGMTELLSQGYSKGDGLFYPCSTLKIVCRDINDPLSVSELGTGGLNIIDFANVYSCAFIESQDLVKLYADGSFEVLGRIDHADIRGCSLMAI